MYVRGNRRISPAPVSQAGVVVVVVVVVVIKMLNFVSLCRYICI